ncbi:MAG: signal peptidase I [Candidatus Baltobacteraceae bacterium]
MGFSISPTVLIAIVGIFLVARIALSARMVAAGPSKRSSHIAREYLDPVIYAGFAAFLLITFVARTYYIPSESMLPTLQVGDVLLVNKFEYRFHAPSRGDIVVFPPPIPSTDDFIKRVIGRPGDKLRIYGGIVYVNGQPLHEGYIAQAPAYNLVIRNYGIYVDTGAGYDRIPASLGNIPPRSQWPAPDRIPKNCYFMMGDNRNDSEDSHIWGFAQTTGPFATGPIAGKAAHFTGHAFVIFWPFSHAKII